MVATSERTTKSQANRLIKQEAARLLMDTSKWTVDMNDDTSALTIPESTPNASAIAEEIGGALDILKDTQQQSLHPESRLSVDIMADPDMLRANKGYVITASNALLDTFRALVNARSDNGLGAAFEVTQPARSSTRGAA